MATTVNDATAQQSWILRTYSSLVRRAKIAQRLGVLFLGERNMHEILGYKPVLEYRDFKARYVRQDLAHRIVKAYPEATWSQPPAIKEDDTKTETTFEAAWARLAGRLNVFATLARADLLANLGQYSVILIGLRSQSDLKTLATPVRGDEDVLYLTPYSEEWATIDRLETNAALPSFGKPLIYRIDFSRSTEAGKIPVAARAVPVHASRVIHVAEDVLDDDVYGIPRLEPLFDKLDDLLKVVGGAAEMFWRDAKRRVALELRNDYTLDKADEEALTNEVAEYMHDMKDFIRVAGVDVKNMSGVVASPKEHFEVLLDVIAGTSGIPRSVLTGAARGGLIQAEGTEDSANWKERITQRQRQFAEPRILRALIDRLIDLRALPAPAQPYTVAWDNLLSLSEEKQATVAKDVATALSQFAGPGMGQSVVTVQEFRSEYLGLPPEPEEGFLDLAPGEDTEEDDDADNPEAEDAA
jgi:uncharacterized protein